MLSLHDAFPISLQALDASLAGASLRDVGEGLFGADAVADWYSDGGLRSKVRRLVRRGDALMRGGYRHLAQLPPLEKGDRKSTRLNPVTNAHLVCRLLLEKKKTRQKIQRTYN